MIVACCNNNGIGYQNKIPWFIKNDLKYFSKLTKGKGNNAVIMGRKTWDSLPKKPLPNRENIILSKTEKQELINVTLNKSKTYFFTDVNKALRLCENTNIDELWIMGGTKIYELFYNEYNDIIDKIFVTRVSKDYKCDVFFPDISESFTLTDTIITTEWEETLQENITIEYQILERKIKE